MESESEIQSRLKFISKIQKGEKINTKYLYIQPVGFLTGIARSLFNQDNRSNTLAFLQNTIIKTFDILKLYCYSGKRKSDYMICLNILKDLKQAKIGLLNIKETYILDLKFCCDIDILVQQIEIVLIENEENEEDKEDEENEENEELKKSKRD